MITEQKDLWNEYNGKGFAAKYSEYAERSTADEDGNAISTTYATKSEVAEAIADVHTHSNKAILDATTASYTAEEQTKLNGIEPGAEVNKIDEVLVNNTAVTIENKSVNISVPTVSKSTYQIPDEYETVLIGTRKYKIVTIGNQQWMAENLDYAWDGLTVNASGSGETPLAYYYGRGSKSTYGIDGTYKCGLLYNHPAVEYLHNNRGSLLPDGWVVPTETDWQTLLTAVGGASAALSKLKAKPASVSSAYPPQAWGGTDDYEFNILPVGFMDNNLYTAGLNNRTMLWTLTHDGVANRRCIDFDTNTSAVGFGSFNLLYDLSIRLVKNITTGA